VLFIVLSICCLVVGVVHVVHGLRMCCLMSVYLLCMYCVVGVWLLCRCCLVGLFLLFSCCLLLFVVV